MIMLAILVHSTVLQIQILSINLIKRSGVRIATVPDLVDHLGSMNVVLAVRTGHYRECRPSPYALLMLLHYFEVELLKELLRPSAFST